MPGFLIDNIFAVFGGHVFQQTIYVFKGTNISPTFSSIRIKQIHFIKYLGPSANYHRFDSCSGQAKYQEICTC